MAMRQSSKSGDPMRAPLATFRDPARDSFEDAWVGMEPTFQSAKSVRKWRKMSAEPGGEDAYFEDPWMLRKQKRVAKAVRDRYRRHRTRGEPWCMFGEVSLESDLDQWKVRRQNLLFRFGASGSEPFEARLSLDPETFEWSIKPVPLAWFYDERFLAFLEEYVWKTPARCGLSCSMAHGGGQFSLSAKTFLRGSLLADDIATKLNHPELASWVMDWPNPDDRAFRATKARFEAFRRVLGSYRAGEFHPAVKGLLTAENAYLDRGFGPARAGREGLMDPAKGPLGGARDVFQTNFAFGRTVRLEAQNVHPGYWQSSHPDEDGYRPDQIMRYSEGNLNRLQIVGEWHVKSGKVLEAEKAPELESPLDLSMLTTEASWENRAQMSRTSARDYVEALLLDVHHARWLAAHPGVAVEPTLLQDQILGDAEETLRRLGRGDLLERLREEARGKNLAASGGRMKTDWIEPETLFWAAYWALPAGERAAIAREAVSGFVERVHQASSADPRGERGDPMEWHRHRIHPLLWDALEGEPASTPVGRELDLFRGRRKAHLARRPAWSPLKRSLPPWEEMRRRSGQGT